MTHITSESNNSDYWTVGTKIIFKPHFNDILEKYHVLMQNYSEIYFSNYEDFDTFIKIHENSFLSKSVYKKYVSNKFNRYIENLPNNITHLVISNEYNRSIINLPTSIKYFKIGDSYEHRIPLLPEGLTHLILGSRCMSGLSKLPSTLEYFNMSGLTESLYNSNNRILPSGLKTLIVGPRYEKSLPELPSGLLHLEFVDKNNECLFNFKNIYEFPKSLEYLIFSKLSRFDEPINLSERLLHLEFGNDFNHNLPMLPSTLRTLIFGLLYDKSFDYSLPPNLKTLVFGNCFNKQLDKLPPGLENLKFGYKYNHPISEFPESLKVLIFGHKFNQVLRFLPENLQHLELGHDFDYELETLPNLKYLSVGSNMNIINQLPNSIIELKLTGRFNMKIDNLHYGLEKLSLCDLNYSYDINYIARYRSNLRDVGYGHIFFSNELHLNPNAIFYSKQMTFNEELNCLPNTLVELSLNINYNKKILSFPPSLKKIKFYFAYEYKNDFSEYEIEEYCY